MDAYENCGRAAVFLDRDGTLIEDRGHLARPEDVVFFADTVTALKRLQEKFLLFVVTNQSGIAKGVIRKEDAESVNRHMREELGRQGVKISAIYVCPHQRSDGCECIKPNPHFLQKAADEYGLNLRSSFTVGDHPHDVSLGQAVGAKGVYVCTGHGLKHLAELPRGQAVVPGIEQAADWILERT